ncbi:MAG: rhomboid family intramembrane serine protease [Crocinitomicaceae bacterium]|nr:rhomboid family intramembrane serine protease [Crocinitomicaceae bacterium]
MQQQNVFQYLKGSLKNSGVLGRILLVNTIIYLMFLLLQLVEVLFVKEDLTENVVHYFAAPGNPADLIYIPWTVITSMFSHYMFGHFLFNMLILFFTGIIFLQHFGEKRLLSTYILGGLFAYVAHVGAFYLFPVFAQQSASPVIGASGAIMAVFIAIAFYRPGLKVLLFGLIPVPLFVLAALYILTDLTGITEQQAGNESNIAHFAHLGGVIFGAISIIGVDSSKHFMHYADRFFSWFKAPKISFKRKPKMKVYQGGSQTKNMTDEEFNYNKKLRQERLDAILDKIGKKGYEGLTKEEKDFLFNESQRK